MFHQSLDPERIRCSFPRGYAQATSFDLLPLLPWRISCQEPKLRIIKFRSDTLVKSLSFESLIRARSWKENKGTAMAKRKRNNAQPNAVKKQSTSGIPSPPHDTTTLEPTNVHSIISAEEIEVAVETLQTLSGHPSLIKSKACKDLRTAVYDFRQACTTGLNSAGKHRHLQQRF